MMWNTFAKRTEDRDFIQYWSETWKDALILSLEYCGQLSLAALAGLRPDDWQLAATLRHRHKQKLLRQPYSSYDHDPEVLGLR
jgi:hypothetical protein